MATVHHTGSRPSGRRKALNRSKSSRPNAFGGPVKGGGPRLARAYRHYS